MKKKYAYVLAALVAACDLEPATCDTDAMAPWILDCIKNATQSTDEDPEYAVRECERTAIHLFCGVNCRFSDGEIKCRKKDVQP